MQCNKGAMLRLLIILVRQRHDKRQQCLYFLGMLLEALRELSNRSLVTAKRHRALQGMKKPGPNHHSG